MRHAGHNPGHEELINRARKAMGNGWDEVVVFILLVLQFRVQSARLKLPGVVVFVEVQLLRST